MEEHNRTERERRLDLHNLFKELQATLPIFNKRELCPKLEILTMAQAHIQNLERTGAQLEKKVEALKARRAQLMLAAD